MKKSKIKFSLGRYTVRSKIIAATVVAVMTLVLALSGYTANGLALEEPAVSVLAEASMMPRRAAFVPGVATVHMEGASVELDLSVTVFLESGEIASGFPFSFDIKPEDKPEEKLTIIDEDLDGQVYVEDLEAGDYEVKMVAHEGVNTVEPMIVTVQPKVVYTAVDVSEKIVNAKDIDTSDDDKQYGGGTSTTGGDSAPPPTADTVEYVESTKTVKKQPLLDSSGNQVYKYKPILAANGCLLKADGSASDIIPILDANGYITDAHRLSPDSTAPVGGDEPPVEPPVDPPVEPPVDPPVEPPAEPTYVNCKSEVLDANGVPLSSNGTMLFQFKAVAQTSGKEVTTYTGWQNLNGRVQYYDKHGNFVTGWQTIQGITYFFGSDGNRGGTIGIDVSTWQGSIDWAAVKASGVDYVFVRLGFRGYSTGRLVMDDMYHNHMRGAIAAGLKVGVYFFTQAINETEAVEEASMCLQLVAGYKISYPIVIDIEDSGSSSGRANRLTNEQRTKICVAFCETIRNAGYKAGVYANKYYFTSLLNTSQLEKYVIWLAHYTDFTSYARRYDIWQYTSQGKVKGVSGNVDMNISYI